MQQERFQLVTRNKTLPTESAYVLEQVTRLCDLHLQRYPQLNQTRPWTTSLDPALRMVEWNDLQRSLPI